MGIFLFSMSSVAMISVMFVDAASLNSFQDDSHFRVDNEDCPRFYIRRNGKEIQMKCPDDHVVNTNTRSCVPKGSLPDTCVNMRKSNESGKCTGKSDKIANTESCAKYYACRDAIPASSEPNLKECPFPYLFDEKLQECLHFSQVDCGTRYEPKDACEYGENQCKSSHCIPCHIRFPSCKGSPDGLNPWTGREWTPYFVVCQNERLMFQGQCPVLSNKMPTIFHPVNSICVEMEIHH
ncbi:uncharacterized protein LOC111110440 [Crassostrea virginica]